MNCTCRQEAQDGIDLVVLSCDEGTRSASAFVAPEYGANLCRWVVDGNAVIDFDPSVLKAHGYTGTPVLYPTPSCVRDGTFRYKGRVFRYHSPHRPAYEHGLVHDRPWQWERPVIGGDGVSLKLWLDFVPGTPQYEAFPFRHALCLQYTLRVDSLTIDWSIHNQGDEEIPFGFALHPYFMKLSGERDTLVRVPAQHYMEATPDLLPTGRLIDVAGLPCDVRTPNPIGLLHLDHVFTDLMPGRSAVIQHRTVPLTVKLLAGPSLTHIVFYSPEGERFFCVENMSCSTDAHNLFDKGYARESGLKTVPGKGVFRDFIRYDAKRQCGDDLWG